MAYGYGKLTFSMLYWMSFTFYMSYVISLPLSSLIIGCWCCWNSSDFRQWEIHVLSHNNKGLYEHLQIHASVNCFFNRFWCIYNFFIQNLKRDDFPTNYIKIKYLPKTAETVEKVFFPILSTSGANHWYCCVADMKTSTCSILDSSPDRYLAKRREFTKQVVIFPGQVVFSKYI